MRHFIEKLCPNCKGEGCLMCSETGAVMIEVDARTFYKVDGAVWHD